MPHVTRRAASLGLGGALLLAGAGGGAARAQTRTLRFSAASNRGHPQVMGVERFAETVAQKSGGRLVVRAFPGGTLGPDLQVVSAMQGGTVDLNVMNASLLAGNVKEMAALDLPFLFASAREADAVVDGPVGRALLDKLPARGLIGLAYWDLGFRQMHTRTRPIARADDLRGLKMRVIPTPIYIDLMNALGANAVPMPFTETYTALETGTVDGMTNPLLNILDGKYQEVTKHLAITDHIYTPQVVIASKRTWDKLPEEDRAILQAAATETTGHQRAAAREAAVKVLDALKAAGMSVTVLPPDEIAKLRERAKPVTAKYTKELGEGFVAELNAAVETARGKA